MVRNRAPNIPEVYTYLAGTSNRNTKGTTLKPDLNKQYMCKFNVISRNYETHFTIPNRQNSSSSDVTTDDIASPPHLSRRHKRGIVKRQYFPNSGFRNRATSKDYSGILIPASDQIPSPTADLSTDKCEYVTPIAAPQRPSRSYIEEDNSQSTTNLFDCQPFGNAEIKHQMVPPSWVVPPCPYSTEQYRRAVNLKYEVVPETLTKVRKRFTDNPAFRRKIPGKTRKQDHRSQSATEDEDLSNDGVVYLDTIIDNLNKIEKPTSEKTKKKLIVNGRICKGHGQEACDYDDNCASLKNKNFYTYFSVMTEAGNEVVTDENDVVEDKDVNLNWDDSIGCSCEEAALDVTNCSGLNVHKLGNIHSATKLPLRAPSPDISQNVNDSQLLVVPYNIPTLLVLSWKLCYDHYIKVLLPALWKLCWWFCFLITTFFIGFFLYDVS